MAFCVVVATGRTKLLRLRCLALASGSTGRATRLQGKGVWTFPHADTAGANAAGRWAGQLHSAGALWVKPFDFAPYTLPADARSRTSMIFAPPSRWRTNRRKFLMSDPSEILFQQPTPMKLRVPFRRRREQSGSKLEDLTAFELPWDKLLAFDRRPILTVSWETLPLPHGGLRHRRPVRCWQIRPVSATRRMRCTGVNLSSACRFICRCGSLRSSRGRSWRRRRICAGIVTGYGATKEQVAL